MTDVSEAPERIWADPDHWLPHNPDNFDGNPSEYVQYIRADLHAATEAKLARAVEALERVDRSITYPVCTEINRSGYDVRPASKELNELVGEIVRAAIADVKGDG